MASALLKRLLNKRTVNGTLRQQIEATELPVMLLDDQQTCLFEHRSASIEQPQRQQFMLEAEGQPQGWLVGDARAAAMAVLLNHLLQQEMETRQLADEMLSLYREVNLLYTLSEKLSASLELNQVLAVALEEAGRSIRSTGSAIFLRSEQNGRMESYHTWGEVLRNAGLSEMITAQLMENSKAEIVNEVRDDKRYQFVGEQFQALVAAPLISREVTIGWLLLVHDDANSYSARDLKLLTALASQVAPALDHVLLRDRTLREAAEREAQLQLRIEALRIELDEARQEEKVNEIVESEYFQRLRSQSNNLRMIMDGEDQDQES